MRATQPLALGPVLEFMRSLWALDHALASSAKRVGTRFGITATQRLVLRIIAQTPGTSAGMVSRVLHVHPSTLTPVLQQVVDRGLVRRTADPVDRRRAVLWLTARGERIDATSARELDNVVRGTLARLAPSEVSPARRVMDAVTGALSQTGPRPQARRMRTRRGASKVTRLGIRSRAPKALPRPQFAETAAGSDDGG